MCAPISFLYRKISAAVHELRSTGGPRCNLEDDSPLMQERSWTMIRPLHETLEADSSTSVTSGRRKSIAGATASTCNVLKKGKNRGAAIQIKCLQKTEQYNLAKHIPKPKKHKAKIMLWTDLNVNAVDRLNESTESEHVKQVLADLFMLQQYKKNPKVAIIMDLFYNTLQFAKKHHFGKDKTSAFFSIIKNIFEVSVETPFDNLEHTQQYFDDLIVCHSIHHPPYSTALFTSEDVLKIQTHTANTFFRHFEMYKYAYTFQVELDIKFNYVGMQSSSSSSEAGTEDIDINDRDEHISDVVEAGLWTTDPAPVSNDKEDVKKIVSDFISKESQKMNSKMNQHIQLATDALILKLASLIPKETLDETKMKE